MFRKKTEKATYDKENEFPIVRASICTGEQVAGFKNIHTGKFSEACVIHNDRELQDFAKLYGIGINDIKKEYTSSR